MKVKNTMQRGIAVATLLLAAAAVIGAGLPAQHDLPTRELDPLFARRGKTRGYTQAMLELGMRMGAATRLALRGDAAAGKAIASFREQNTKVAAMVASWKSSFPTGAIEQLAAAVKSGKAQSLHGIIDRIEGSCTDCHVRNMFAVQARYRWGDFSEVTVPVDKKNDISFHQVMLDLANGLGAVRNDVDSGQFDAAKVEYAQLKERFTSMELACEYCHDEPREYFIDSRVKGRLLKLGGLLRKGKRQLGDYNQLLNEINEMSCFPCHQVHMPAAFLQEHWRRGGR